MGIVDWTDLLCECGSNAFRKIISLKWHPNSGMTENSNGWECTKCSLKADSGRLVEDAQLRQKEKELKTLTAEMEERRGMKATK